MIDNVMFSLIGSIICAAQLRCGDRDVKHGCAAACWTFLSVGYEGWHGPISLVAILAGAFALGLAYAVALQRRGAA